MTRKDYERIAAELSFNRPSDTTSTATDRGYDRGYQRAVDAIAHAFKADNSRFDRDRFQEATK
jgi:phosphoheptose isomerase